MPARKPATAQEIHDTLLGNEFIESGGAIQYWGAVRYLARSLHTTTTRAATWLTQATKDEPHNFELVGTDSGQIRHVARGGQALALDEAGYASEDSDTWPYLSHMGAQIYEADFQSRNPDYVILTSDLRTMCTRAYKAKKEERHALLVKRQKMQAEIDAKAGKSMTYIRGLVQLLAPDENVELSERVSSGGSVFVSLTVRDSGVDALAAALAAHDIEPFPATQVVTRKPVPEATK